MFENPLANSGGVCHVAHSLALLSLAFLVGIASLTASAGAAGAAPNPNKPIVFPVDQTFPAPNLTNRCGFAVTAHVFGTFTVKVLPNGVEIDRIRYQHVFTGPGGSLTSNHVENVRFTAVTSPDGALVETVTATGTLLYHIVVPGHGSIRLRPRNLSGHLAVR